MEYRLSTQTFSLPRRSVLGGHLPSPCSVGPDACPSQCGGKLRGCTGKRHDLPADAELMAGVDPNRHVWFVRSGILRLQRHGFHGRRQVLSLTFAGEIIGYETQLREGMSVVAATPCRVCKIEKREFDALLRAEPDLRKDFILQQQAQLDLLLWLTWSIGSLRPDERFAAFLALSTRLMPYQPLSDGTGILSILLPRLDIADLLSTTVETISRTSHRMAEDGIIQIRDPFHFRILDMKRLISLGQIGNFIEGFITPSTQNNRLNNLMGFIASQSDSAGQSDSADR